MDFPCHTIGYPTAKHPQCCASYEKHPPHEQRQVAFFFDLVIHELWEEQMWGNRYHFLPDCKPAVSLGIPHIGIDITGKGRADENKRSESCFLLLLAYLRQCFIAGWIGVSFCVILVDAHCEPPVCRSSAEHSSHSTELTSMLPFPSENTRARSTASSVPQHGQRVKTLSPRSVVMTVESSESLCLV